jgi:hypothetical protein
LGCSWSRSLGRQCRAHLGRQVRLPVPPYRVDTGDSKAAAALAARLHESQARAEVAAVFRRAGLRAAAEMGAPATKVIEAQPTHA